MIWRSSLVRPRRRTRDARVDQLRRSHVGHTSRREAPSTPVAALVVASWDEEVLGHIYTCEGFQMGLVRASESLPDSKDFLLVCYSRLIQGRRSRQGWPTRRWPIPTNAYSG
jgi:hypothetical protein